MHRFVRNEATYVTCLRRPLDTAVSAKLYLHGRSAPFAPTKRRTAAHPLPVPLFPCSAVAQKSEHEAAALVLSWLEGSGHKARINYTKVFAPTLLLCFPEG